MTLKRAVYGMIALTMAGGVLAGAMVSCSGDGASGTDWGIPATLVLSEMTAAQRETFCGRVSDPGAVCNATSQNAGGDKTPVEVCLDSFTSLPNCTVAQYQKCMEEAKRDPCGAAATPACQELESCQGEMNLQCSDLRGGAPYHDVEILCATEMVSGIGAIVWAIRRAKDNCSYSVYQYCITYSYLRDPTRWVKGCVTCY